MTVTCSPVHATTGHGGCICSAVFGRGGGEAVGAHDPTLTPAAARWHGLQLHHADRTIRGIERCICAQLCRGESGSHVQVAGASLAGNDHSLSSSTLIGWVSWLFGRGRAGTGSSLCGSVEGRSSMDEKIR